MGLLDKLRKRKKEEQVEEVKEQPAIKDMPMTEISLKYEPTVFQKYPNGLPLTVLEYIDYSKFGAMLKQERLLPPSYDRRPAEIEVFLDAENIASVELVFKSKSSNSYRVLNIHKYNIAYSKNRSYALTANAQICEVWRNFAEKVMWAWERGYNYALVSPEKNIETYKKPRVNEATITKLKEIECECKNKVNIREY